MSAHPASLKRKRAFSEELFSSRQTAKKVASTSKDQDSRSLQRATARLRLATINSPDTSEYDSNQDPNYNGSEDSEILGYSSVEDGDDEMESDDDDDGDDSEFWEAENCSDEGELSKQQLERYERQRTEQIASDEAAEKQVILYQGGDGHVDADSDIHEDDIDWKDIPGLTEEQQMHRRRLIIERLRYQAEKQRAKLQAQKDLKPETLWARKKKQRTGLGTFQDLNRSDSLDDDAGSERDDALNGYVSWYHTSDDEQSDAGNVKASESAIQTTIPRPPRQQISSAQQNAVSSHSRPQPRTVVLYENEPSRTPPAEYPHPTKDGDHGGKLPTTEDAKDQPLDLRRTAHSVPNRTNITFLDERLTNSQRSRLKMFETANSSLKQMDRDNKCKEPSSQNAWSTTNSFRPFPKPAGGLWDNLPLEAQPDIKSRSDNSAGLPQSDLTKYLSEDYIKRSRMQLENLYNNMPGDDEEDWALKSLIWKELDLNFRQFVPPSRLTQDAHISYTVDFSIPYVEKGIALPGQPDFVMPTIPAPQAGKKGTQKDQGTSQTKDVAPTKTTGVKLKANKNLKTASDASKTAVVSATDPILPGAPRLLKVTHKNYEAEKQEQARNEAGKSLGLSTATNPNPMATTDDGARRSGRQGNRTAKAGAVESGQSLQERKAKTEAPARKK